MTQPDLNALERNVEQARARFANDLARLRSPTNLARFKEDLWAEARNAKDEWVDTATEAAKDGLQRALTAVKERAVANPAAAFAIGAGVAWRLFQRPPIASLLIGVGVLGLLRTSPSQHGSHSYSYMDLYDEDPEPLRRDDGQRGIGSQVSAVANAAKEKARDWSAQATETARQTMTAIADKATSASDRASDVLRETAGAATRIADKAATVADRASDKLQDVLPDQDDRNTYLLGAAALAVAAAVGIAYQRRAREDSP
jgi:hypothetical protein